MYYIFNLLLPCILIAAITLMGFLLPADSGEKVSLGITVLLSLTVFLLLIAESMPPSSIVPIIGQYYAATMVLVSFSILLTVMVLNLHHRGPYCKSPPMLVRKILLGKVAYYLRLQPDHFKNEPFLSRGKECSNGSRTSSFQRYRSKFVETRDSCNVEKVKLNAPPDSPILGISRGRKDDRSCCEHSEEQLILMRRMTEHIRYVRKHFEGIELSEDIRNEWKQIAMVVDRMFAIFYLLGTIGTVMILVFKIS